MPDSTFWLQVGLDAPHRPGSANSTGDTRATAIKEPGNQPPLDGPDESASQSLAEFLATCDPTEGWGPWRLEADELVLTIPEHDYWGDLRQCRTSAEVLDWIMQIAGKAWTTDTVLAGLVRAVDTVLDPQANLCSQGRPSAMTIDQIRASAISVAAHNVPGDDT